jgi:membrane protease YdiL (CAAX protease family)
MAGVAVASRRSLVRIGQPAASLALALLWSWAWWGIAIRSGGTETTIGGLTWLIGGFGPTLGVLYALRGQSIQYRKDFKRRLISWRFPPVFWALALGFAVGPKLISLGIATVAGHSASGEAMSVAEIPFGLIFALIVVWIEEPLWRGTALDAFGSAWLKAALAIGLVWSVWHVPLFAVEGTFQQAELGLGTLDFWVFCTGVVGLSVFLTWIVGRTGSILVAMFTHLAINMNGMLLPDDTTIRILEMAVILLVAAGVIVRERAWKESWRAAMRTSGSQ